MGDPSGIGPEVVVKAVADENVAHAARWIVIGDKHVLGLAERVTNLRLRNAELQCVTTLDAVPDFSFGKLDPRYGQAALEYVRFATKLCLSGQADAMVTAPVNKEAVALSGRPFSGHTEYIAELCGAGRPRMLPSSDRLSTVHVSTHVSLRTACELDTAEILRTIELGHSAMQLLGFAAPRLAVCGLNPHAGEHGLFGDEDERFIVPAIQQARAQGLICSGPHAADTIFLQASRGGYDLVVAMYHDQGHVPMKLIDFEGTVNISLGIPIIRTSVDHGTAFDIAGLNKGDAHSMKRAMLVAAQMAKMRAANRSLSREPKT
ncbi:MAG: 4-hydroxythreonine-4-phosphate dehydrogenase PdxA [Acidobacteriaceae bacterium]|nr:4-hydroxythreonine-4-phosphate dehydrogenase PdxA [Acidobacteriaceae bacterium]